MFKDMRMTVGVVLGIGTVVLAQRLAEIVAARRLAERPSRDIDELVRQVGLPWYDSLEEIDALSLDLYHEYLNTAMHRILLLNDLDPQERHALSSWLQGQFHHLRDRVIREGEDAPLSWGLFQPAIQVEEEK